MEMMETMDYFKQDINLRHFGVFPLLMFHCFSWSLPYGLFFRINPVHLIISEIHNFALYILCVWV